ncbi:MAG: hypothetical protein ACOYM3_13825, partial [Terrimicrobiaceae bacterium]
GQSYMHVPALLGRTGLPVDVVMTHRHPLRRIQGVSRAFLTSPAEWAGTLEERLLTGEYAMLLNVDEPGLHALYRHSWHPEAIKFLPYAPDSGAAATVGSKTGFYDWCQQHGLPFPETRKCSSFREACTLVEELPGDWLLKADSGSGGLNVMRCPSELAAAAIPDQESLSSWLIQRDEGPDVGSGIFLADRGRLLSWMGIKKIVCLNKGYGPTVLGCGDVSDEVGDLCERVAAASGVSGLTGFDFVRSPERGLGLIDSHLGRMSPMQHFDRLYQVDFAAALRGHLDGKVCAVIAPQHGPAFIKFPEVLQLAMQGGLGKLWSEARYAVKMPLSPDGDAFIGFHSACHIVTSQARVNLGSWRRELFASRVR